MGGILFNNNAINQKGTPLLYTDIFANRPQAAIKGRLFFSTDTSAIYEDTGTAWTLLADAGILNVGTLEQVTTNGNSTDQGITITANGLTSNQVVISGGTASQFLKANGTLDSNTYLTTSSASSTYQPLITLTTTGTSGAATFSGNTLNIPNYGTALSGYLPLSGGTLTGTLIGTGIVLTNGITASSFNTIGGTSSQFLKANGSLDSNTYLTTSSAASTYLPLSGGTLTGALSGTSATFSSSVTAASQIKSTNTSGTSFYTNTYVTNSVGDRNYGTYSGGLREDTSYNLNFDLYDRTAATWRTPITIINNGNVGIRTTSPSTQLQIADGAISNASGSNNINVYGSVSAGDAAQLYLYQKWNSLVYPVGIAASYDNVYGSAAAGLSFYASAYNGSSVTTTKGMYMNPIGNVGIGTTSPSQSLHVVNGSSSTSAIFVGSSNSYIQLGNTVTANYIGNNGGNLAFQAGASTNMTITSGGNVLIGTTTDAGYKLQVNGTASVTQIITAQTWLNASTFNQSFTISPANGAGTTIISNNSTNYTWTMEPAVSNNRMYILRTIGSNTITINTSGSDVIINNAGSSVSSLTMTSSTGAIILQSDGSSRWIQIK